MHDKEHDEHLPEIVVMFIMDLCDRAIASFIRTDRDNGRWMALESVLENDRVLRYLPAQKVAS